MKELFDKLRSLEEEISDEKGGFALFALFLREEAVDRWDLVVAAPWFGNDKKKTLDYLTRKLRSYLTAHELVSLSRIVLVKASEPSVQAINAAVEVEHGAIEVRDTTFFGLQIKHAYIITSKRNGQPARATA